MPQPPSPHPGTTPPGPGHDDDYAAGYRDGLANEVAYVSAAGEAQALFADLLEPGAVEVREERYLRGYLQGQNDRQHQNPGAITPGRPIATKTECRQGNRLRAAIDRLHAAQLAALAARAAPDDDCLDVFGAARRLLEMVAEMGSLLVRLGQLADADEGAAAARLRLVTLATASANMLAVLVGLTFDLGGGPAAGPGRARAGAGPGEMDAGPSPERAPTSMRAVTDGNRLLVDQLKRLMQNASRRESWRSRPPGELWRGLLAQVAGLLPLVAELEAGPLPEAGAKQLARLAADAANYIAFIRFYPRLPTA